MLLLDRLLNVVFVVWMVNVYGKKIEDAAGQEIEKWFIISVNHAHFGIQNFIHFSLCIYSFVYIGWPMSYAFFHN